MSDWLLLLRGDPEHLETSTAPRARDAALTDLGASATSWAIAVATHVHDDLVAAETAGELALSGYERAALESSVLAMLTGLAASRAPVIPEEAVTQVRWSARQGMTIDNLLKVIWRSHARVQELLLAAMTDQVPPDRLAAEIHRTSAGLLAFVAELVDGVSGIFATESEAWGRHRSASIRRAVDGVVEQGEAGAGVEEVLGLRWQWHHVGAVLWPHASSPDPGWSQDSAQWVESVRERLSARSVLVVPRTDGSTEAVWSCGSAPDPDAVRNLRQLALPRGFSCAIGFDSSGAAGFRESLLTSRRLAKAVRRHARPRTWLSDEHGALALLMQDDEAAASFVRKTLAGLTGTDPRDGVLRETLLAFLENQGSRSAAAEELHIAATTVAYRVQQAEARLERPTARRRNSVVNALTLAGYFPHLLPHAAELSPDDKL